MVQNESKVRPGDWAVAKLEELGGTVGDALLETHPSFLPQLEPLLNSGKIKGLAHITGGGFLENIPRILPEGVSVEIRRGTWNEPAVFGVMQKLGNVAEAEMFRTFNMGIGMVVICNEGDQDHVMQHLNGREIGKVVAGDRSVAIKSA